MRKRPAPKLPAFLFYPGDWKKDTQLSKCSLAARGAWIELLCAMHENGRTGIVTGTIEELAQICRCKTEDLKSSLDDLKNSKTAHVMVRNKNVTVVNRRMRREHIAREKNKLRVQRHREKDDVMPEYATSSSSSSSSSSKERLVSEDLSRERESSSPTKKHSLSDSDFEEFQEAYSHIDDVRFVYDKQTRYLGREPTRQEFLGWLNREIPNRKGNGANDDDDRGTSAQAARVAAMLERDN
jgi:hypothetical protein